MFVWLLSGLVAQTQPLQPHGYFHQDTIKVGQEVSFSLWLDYPYEQTVVFPDSLYNFSPFELVRRQWFPTRTDSLISRDSAVYYLTTFELDTIQYLRLPVYRVNKFDSTLFFTPVDSVVLDFVIKELPDSVQVKLNTTYQPLKRQFNYPYLLIGLGLLALLALIVIFGFGKQIHSAWQIYRLKRWHRLFVKQFDQKLAQPTIQVEELLAFWKAYLQKIMHQPFSSLTTKEIVALTGNDRLATALKAIDRYIYAGERSVPLKQVFEELLLYATDQYHDQLNRLHHAKRDH